MEVLGETETVRPGETVKARIRARRYAGGPPPGARYEVFLYRTLLDSPAWVDDAGLGAQGSAVTYGSVSTTEGKLSVPERLYSSLEARQQGYSDDPWSTAPTFDEKGEAEVEIAVPALTAGDERFPWRYSLVGPRPRRPGHLRRRGAAVLPRPQRRAWGSSAPAPPWPWPAAAPPWPSAPPRSRAPPTATPGAA